MSSIGSQTPSSSSSRAHSPGHLRAQHAAMNYSSDLAYEVEKASIRSYEENWDDWDGPIYPWRETNHPETTTSEEEHYDTCCSTSAYELEKAGITSYEQGWDEWDGPLYPWRETNHPEEVAKKVTPKKQVAHELWKARCPNCGH